MLKIDEGMKEVRAVKKGGCRGMNMHFERGLLLNLF
jgi:hypothetical protein